MEKKYTYRKYRKGLRNRIENSGLGVTCSHRDPRFAVSNPAEVDGFLSGRKIPENKPPGSDFKLWVQSLRFQAR